MTKPPHNEHEPLVLAGQGRDEGDVEFEGWVAGTVLFFLVIGATILVALGWNLFFSLIPFL